MIIGLTGSIASGKSTVSKMLADLGYPIVDADVVARQVVEPGTQTLKEIEAIFGTQVILPDGTLHRSKLGQMIFNDPASRQQLNAVIHPAIRKELLRQRDAFLAEGHETVVLDIPLLFESKLLNFAEKILVVSVTEENQLNRLMERNGLTEQEALARIGSQLPMAVKEAGADAVIFNNGTLEETRRQLLRVLEIWGLKSGKD
ncbi:dephospho-CoA kinase [Planomicrobium sp. CPCC 101079]|uniref:dephospho-CoA kinase n=1 Tax=Planomicrobium sp. CPCC 101079 TaxID=2599618 RepID=UPI0011B38523|nr:dephospho-CoA kinase [Planomicrobium sp. CPCC 101079]TWT08940.1 dephospho-CoA kinase [Planomicrobium sp. CPCC 101079]